METNKFTIPAGDLAYPPVSHAEHCRCWTSYELFLMSFTIPHDLTDRSSLFDPNRHFISRLRSISCCCQTISLFFVDAFYSEAPSHVTVLMLAGLSIHIISQYIILIIFQALDQPRATRLPSWHQFAYVVQVACTNEFVVCPKKLSSVGEFWLLSGTILTVTITGR